MLREMLMKQIEDDIFFWRMEVRRENANAALAGRETEMAMHENPPCRRSPEYG